MLLIPFFQIGHSLQSPLPNIVSKVMEVFKQMQVWWKQIELSVRLVLGGHNLPTSPQLMI